MSKSMGQSSQGIRREKKRKGRIQEISSEIHSQVLCEEAVMVTFLANNVLFFAGTGTITRPYS